MSKYSKKKKYVHYEQAIGVRGDVGGKGEINNKVI